MLKPKKKKKNTPSSLIHVKFLQEPSKNVLYLNPEDTVTVCHRLVHSEMQLYTHTQPVVVSLYGDSRLQETIHDASPHIPVWGIVYKKNIFRNGVVGFSRSHYNCQIYEK